MYLSRVEIDTNNRYKIRDLTHLGAYHNWVEQSFPKEIASGKRLRHLWRIDQLGDKKYLLVLSEDKPELRELEKYGVSGTAATKPYGQLLDSLKVGQIVRFRLTANPTHKVRRFSGDQVGHVVPHVTVAQQCKWLLDRSEKSGFELLEQPASVFEANQLRKAFNVTNREYPILRKKKGGTVKLSRVTFEGVLRITDVDAFRVVMMKGLGREKAYGMGLLTILPGA